MLICVDGTGPGPDEKYKERTATSFVRTIFRTSSLQKKYYFRGPDWKGFGGKLVKPLSLVAHIQTFRTTNEPILMAGFSRGGAIVINTAALLKQRKIEVEALFLFDAVDRSFELDAKIIPSNVRHVCHAIRKSEAASRESFGNCGVIRQGGISYAERSFLTTHGGVGGTLWGERGVAPAARFVGLSDAPWENRKAALERLGKHKDLDEKERAQRQRFMTSAFIDEKFSPDADTKITIEQERIGMEEVRGWMWPYLRKHGVL